MTCLRCQHLNLRADKDMAEGGYAGCTQRKSWQSVSVHKPACDHFADAGKLIVDKRSDYLERVKK